MKSTLRLMDCSILWNNTTDRFCEMRAGGGGHLAVVIYDLSLFNVPFLQANEAYLRHLPPSRHDSHRLELSFPMTSNHFGAGSGSRKDGSGQKQNRCAAGEANTNDPNVIVDSPESFEN